MAGKGFTTLALAYFGAPGLPRSSQLSFIWEGDCFLKCRSYASLPLEYFEAALDVLGRHCRKEQGVGVVGSSKGGDLALALAVTQGSKVELKSFQAMHIIHLRHEYL